MRIQQRIGVRRTRDRWLRPVMVLGSVVVVAAIAVGGVAIARHGNGANTVGPAQSSTPTPTANPVSTDGFPAQAFFPFAGKAEEAAWEQEFAGGHSPWQSDPVAVSEAWAQNYVKQGTDVVESSKSVNATSADVTMSRDIGGNTHPVTIVHLVKFHNAWLVTGASSPDGELVIASPAPGASVTSPLTVSGPGFGVEQRANVQVRDAETPELLGEARTGMFGNGTEQWSASPSFTPSQDGVGVIVVSIASPADGGVGEFTAQKVVFGNSSSTNTSAGFYGVVNGSIEKFSGGGAPQGPVAGSDAHGTVAEVHDVGGTLYFTAGATDCAPTLYSVPTSGGTAVGVADADAGYGITGFDVAADGRVVYFETGCGTNGGKAKLVFPHFSHGPSGRTIDFQSMPPAIVGDPVWESDGVHVDAFVRTGMSGYFARYDSATSTSTMPRANACAGYDVNNAMPGALTTAPEGTLWFAVQTGTSMQVISCGGDTPTVQMTVSANNTPASLSVDASGDVLLADVDGHVWSGTPDGSQTAITGSSITSVTW